MIAQIALSLCLAHVAVAQASSPSQASGHKESVMKGHATGTFDVKLVPQPADEQAKSAGIGRMSGDKQWHGDLSGVSKVEMLSFGTGAKGSSGGYVALEQFTGTLAGRTGSFVLQHSGTMTRGVPTLSISVVPDSGTGQRAGIAGTLNIVIADGKHSYDFEYTLPETH
jgi:hypothetical protein